MSASIVVGQPDFTSNSANQGGSAAANTLSGPRSAIIADGKLIIMDSGNNRVLIWNSVPTANNAPADVVIGQTSMTNTTSLGCTAQGISPGDSGLLYVNGKLFVVSAAQHRVLIFNSIPTSNGASADVVIGQPNFTTCTANTGGIGANTLSSPTAVASDGAKLFVSDSGNNRVLIFNTIPTTNGASANVVVGQPDFVTSSAGTSQSKFSNPRGVAVHNGKLAVGERGNYRITIFNSIPTSNGASADVVLGQSDFTTASTSPPSTSSTVHPFFISIDDKGRLFSADRNASRYLIWNSIPTSNNTAADIVIGQPNFTSTTENNGGIGANTVAAAKGIFANDGKMVIADQGGITISNNRVLIFYDVIKTPGLSLNNSPEGRDNNQIRLKGTATVDSPYTVSSVQYSINGGGFSNATATDGSFDETSDEFYFDFTPTSNQPKDSNGNLIDGYTVRVKATNNNADTIDRLFYFSPFDLHGPSDNAIVTTNYPSFEFSVNKQRENIRDNLSKYQIQVRKGGSDSAASWETVIDDIPIDFRSVKNNRDNKQWETYGHLDTNNGVYETDKFYATYSDESSRVKVYSKINSMSGTYQWKVVAVDKAGHIQEAGNRNLYVNYRSASSSFPLAVLNISGLGNPYLNTFNLSGFKDTYYTSSSNPIFYGIAWTNSKVVLKLTNQDCKTDCTKTYSTTANAESRYGINVPKGDLSYGKKYTANLSVALEDKYNELPQFTLSIGGLSSLSPETNTDEAEEKEISPTPSPAPSPTPVFQEQQTEPEPSKRCIWFICW